MQGKVEIHLTYSSVLAKNTFWVFIQVFTVPTFNCHVPRVRQMTSGCQELDGSLSCPLQCYGLPTENHCLECKAFISVYLIVMYKEPDK